MAELQARRVVCGKTEGGEWGVVHDGPATAAEQYDIQGGSFDLLNFWADDDLGLDATDRAPQANLGDIFSLVPGATRFLIESMAPTEEPTGWHRTNTIDYEYIVSGQIDLMMDDGSSVTLRAGDVNVQLGGMHQWWNRYAEPCVFVLAMVGANSDEAPDVRAD
ncbi:MAG TPA: cupin domain-containing protein [Acidimicrobiales bacterium]|nr:cupin domain-containing protein [Acidimicrobiales bacterium]